MKGDVHIDLLRRALIWLGNISTGRGIRGCEEITLGEGYIADAACIMGLQMEWDRTLFNDENTLVNKKQYCELREANGWIETDDFSVIVEAKATRADFRNTFFHSNHKGNRLQPRANFHFVVTAKKMIHPSEVPTFWGHLEESRTGVALKKLPKFIPFPVEHKYEFAYRVLRYTQTGKYSIFGMRQELDRKMDELNSLFPSPQQAELKYQDIDAPIIIKKII